MKDPIMALVEQGIVKTTLFPPTSRYYSTDKAILETAQGKIHAYLRRRFISRPEEFTLIHEHTVTQADRLDNIAAKYLGDPEQFWRICDANGVMHPEEVTDTIGKKIRITLPEGIQGG